MDATLSALSGYPFEMFHDIRDVDQSAVYSGLGQRFIQKFSRRPDKWLSDAVFLVPGLFAHEHDCRFRVTLSEHRLGRGLPKIARLADGRFLS
jgi:hypothetical protein